MAAKLLGVTYDSGEAVYAVISRLSDGYLMDDMDGQFSAAPADAYIPLTEDARQKGLYLRSEERQIWTDGAYRLLFYVRSGPNEALLYDAPPIASYELHVRDDAEITLGHQADAVDAVATTTTTINSTLNTVAANVTNILTLVGGATPEQVFDTSEILARVKQIQDKLRLLVLSVEKQSKLKV